MQGDWCWCSFDGGVDEDDEGISNARQRQCHVVMPAGFFSASYHQIRTLRAHGILVAFHFVLIAMMNRPRHRHTEL